MRVCSGLIFLYSYTEMHIYLILEEKEVNYAIVQKLLHGIF